MKFHTGYMDQALYNLPEVIETAREELAEVDFDTLVGTGFSGGVVVPALALALGKKFLLVRKDDDDSHHNGRMLGELGNRWLFVDDFVSSGTTKRRVLDKLSTAEKWGERVQTTYVGDYLYEMRLRLKLAEDELPEVVDVKIPDPPPRVDLNLELEEVETVPILPANWVNLGYTTEVPCGINLPSFMPKRIPVGEFPRVRLP